MLVIFCANAQHEENITIGKKRTFYSKVLNENRKIWIYTPSLTSQDTSSNKQYPVVYLLDGGAHFYSTVGIIQQLSQANGNGVLPEMIVVAIENTDRLRDLVPSADITKPNSFVDFLANELIPYVDKNYSTAPYRLLIGHSLGGLTAIDILTNKPDLFNAYVAIDPSMWYQDELYLENTIRQLPKISMKEKKLFIGVANTMPQGLALSQLKNDTTFETQHIRSIFKLNDFLKSNRNGLSYAHKYYETERHNTVPLKCEYDGLRFVFDFYDLDLSEKDFLDSSALIASKLKAHYVMVSEKMGYQNSAPETLINYFAYDALRKNHFNKAGALFKLNTEWYPESYNVYDSYGDYFLAIKDTSNAISNYKKALQKKDNALTTAKLNALTHEKPVQYSIAALQKYTGVYTLVAFNLDMKVQIRDGKLFAIVPGQADSEFLPIANNVFTVKGKQGYTITFQMNGETPKGFTSVQPNGTFEAVFKNK